MEEKMAATATIGKILDFPFAGYSTPKSPDPKFKPPSKQVYVCSPYRGDVARNTLNAQRYCRFVYEKGYVPVAPHLYYTQFLNDRIPSERAAGIRYGKKEITKCVGLWVFGINITDGMLDEIVFARKKNISVRWFTEDLETDYEKSSEKRC
jgi:hypothetical protein